jgi:hypothetical protein
MKSDARTGRKFPPSRKIIRRLSTLTQLHVERTKSNNPLRARIEWDQPTYYAFNSAFPVIFMGNDATQCNTVAFRNVIHP